MGSIKETELVLIHLMQYIFIHKSITWLAMVWGISTWGHSLQSVMRLKT